MDEIVNLIESVSEGFPSYFFYMSPSDMALHPGNIQGNNNEIQIAESDAAIGHNLGINEAEPIAPKGDKAFRGKIASPARTVH